MYKKASLTGSILFLILGLYIFLAKPFALELTMQGHFILTALSITIGLWIFRPFEIPFSIGGAFFMASMLAVGIPASAVFSGFSGSAVWTLIPALFFGFALAKTGLGKRIAYYGMKIAHLSYGGLLLMWTVIGIALSMLTPSINVRVVIVTPIVLNCVDICKFEKGSKERSLILLTAWAMAIIPGTGWLTGSLTGPILNGFFGSVPDLGTITFNQWIKVGLLPAAIISVLTVIGGYIVLKPSKKLTLSKEVFAYEYKKLGNISKEEKITAIILSAAFLIFVTNFLHHIPDVATCLIAWFLLSAFGIIKGKDISSGISWDLIIFIGTAMGFSAIFAQSGVADWICSILVDVISPLCINPWVFVYGVLLAMFILRFIYVAAFIPTMAILTAVIPQLATIYGIDPLVWVPLITIAMNACFLSYQNMFALVAQTSFNDNGWTQKHFGLYGTAYFLSSLLTMIIAVPYWISIGMF
jgi:anion transporter